MAVTDELYIVVVVVGHLPSDIEKSMKVCSNTILNKLEARFMCTLKEN